MSWAKEHGLGEFGRVQAEQNNTDAKRQQKAKGSNTIRNNNGRNKAQKAKRGKKEASDLPVAPKRAPYERGHAITVLGLDVGAGGQQMAGHPPMKTKGGGLSMLKPN